MAGVKYAPRPYEQAATVLERVESFSHWFYPTHQKKGAVATKLGIGNKKLNRILLLEQLPDDELLKGMMELCNVKEVKQRQKLDYRIHIWMKQSK